jgi:hypothetical protein
MTGEVVNLRRARKAKARADAQAQAAQNRLTFGRTKVERTLAEARDALARRRHEGHKLTSPAETPDRE